MDLWANWYIKVTRLADTVTCFRSMVRTAWLTCSHHTNGEGDKIKLVQRRERTYSKSALVFLLKAHSMAKKKKIKIGKTTDSTLRHATVGLLLC